MTEIFAVETPAGAAGLAVRIATGFRFHAADHLFAGLESRGYRRLEDIHADVRRLAKTPRQPAPARHRGKRRRQEAADAVI